MVTKNRNHSFTMRYVVTHYTSFLSLLRGERPFRERDCALVFPGRFREILIPLAGSFANKFETLSSQSPFLADRSFLARNRHSLPVSEVVDSGFLAVRDVSVAQTAPVTFHSCLDRTSSQLSTLTIVPSRAEQNES